MRGGVDDRIPGVESPRLVLLDLVDEDHRVAGDHPGKREHAEDRHETEGLVGEEQGCDDTNDTQGGDAQHQEQAAEALKLDHQHGERQDEHHRQDGDDRDLRLGALLHGSADVDMVSAPQACVQRRDLRRQRLHDRRGLRTRREVGLHRHRWQSVPTPDDGILYSTEAIWLRGTVRPFGSGT